MLLLVAVKIAVAGGLPIYAISYHIHDDALMVHNAAELLQGNWLGEYGNKTLVKGITFPIFLAVSYLFSVPYTVAQILLYALACAVFVYVLRGFIRNDLLNGLLFALLFFLPVNSATELFLRVYRNNLGPGLVLLLFGTFIGLYLYSGDTKSRRSYMLCAVGAGFSLAAVWNYREDTVWVMPFVVAVCVITTISTVIFQKGKWPWVHCLPVALPIVMLLAINTSVSLVNLSSYGTFNRLDLSNGNFPKMVKAIIAVEPAESHPRVSTPKSSVERLLEVSPSFAELRTSLEKNYGAGWDQIDGTLDGQVEDGFFFWMLRDCMAEAGYFEKAADMERYCGRVADEINAAIRDDRLKKRSGVMPSVHMGPWKNEYFVPLLRQMKDAFVYISRNGGCETVVRPSLGAQDGIRKFETLTNGLAVYRSGGLRVAGWLFSYDDARPVYANIVSNGGDALPLRRSGGEDVFEGFTRQGYSLQNAWNSRFDELLADGAYTLVILMDNVEQDRIPLDGSVLQGGGVAMGYEWHLDALEHQNTEPIEKAAQPRVAILRTIFAAYEKTGLPLFICGLFCYLLLTVGVSAGLIRRKKVTFGNHWLVLTALLGSATLLIAGVAYMGVSTYPATAVSAIYLAPAYPLIFAFSVYAIVFQGLLCAERLKPLIGFG
jgi:hypothetical protein